MVEVLERIAEKRGSMGLSEKGKYSEGRGYRDESAPKDMGYSTFAEMYLEKPIDVQAGFTVTICTWRCVPTIDDW